MTIALPIIIGLGCLFFDLINNFQKKESITYKSTKAVPVLNHQTPSNSPGFSGTKISDSSGIVNLSPSVATTTNIITAIPISNHQIPSSPQNYSGTKISNSSGIINLSPSVTTTKDINNQPEMMDHSSNTALDQTNHDGENPKKSTDVSDITNGCSATIDRQLNVIDSSTVTSALNPVDITDDDYGYATDREKPISADEAALLLKSASKDDQELGQKTLRDLANSGDITALECLAKHHYGLKDLDQAIHYFMTAYSRDQKYRPLLIRLLNEKAAKKDHNTGAKDLIEKILNECKDKDRDAKREYAIFLINKDSSESANIEEGFQILFDLTKTSFTTNQNFNERSFDIHLLQKIVYLYEKHQQFSRWQSIERILHGLCNTSSDCKKLLKEHLIKIYQLAIQQQSNGNRDFTQCQTDLVRELKAIEKY